MNQLMINNIPYLFLDCDGVVNSKHHLKTYTLKTFIADLDSIDPKAVMVLNEIVKKYPNLRIIISSSWRQHHSLDDIRLAFERKGFLFSHQIVDITERSGNKKSRGEEISTYIKENNISKYLILDDEVKVKNSHPNNTVTTTMEKGLTMNHLKLVEEVLNA